MPMTERERVQRDLTATGTEIMETEARLARLYDDRLGLYLRGRECEMTYDELAAAGGSTFGAVAQALRKHRRATEGATA